MTISSTSNKAQFSGSGTTGPFPFSFKVFDSGDLTVVKTVSGTDTTLTITTHYTVSLNADQNTNPGGSVTLLSALAVGQTLTVLREVDASQETDITNGGGFYPEVIENALDKLTMLSQQNAEKISRALVAGVTEDPQAFIQSLYDAEANASASAASASGSASSASASASTATTQADVATVQAGNAAASAASAASIATGIQTQSAVRFTAGGTADAITGTLSPVIASYTAGLRVTATPSGANTVTGPTLNLNSLGAKTVKKRDSSGTKVALAAGDYNASGPFDFEYDGTDFILLNPSTWPTNVRGSDIASAATINLTTATGDIVDVTGTTSITAITLADGLVRQVRFTGALTLTNGASLILPSGANITTAAGDFAVFRGYASGVVRCVSYTKANGQAVVGVGITLGTAVAATSGTSIDFTSIPAGTKKITVMLQGVSTSGTSSVLLQLGDSGGVETSGYAGSVYDWAAWSALSGFSGFSDNTSGASVLREGAFELTLVDYSTNTWACTYMIGFSHSAGGRIGIGTKSLSATLDRVRIATGNGSDTFDAGKVNIAYQ